LGVGKKHFRWDAHPVHRGKCIPSERQDWEKGGMRNTNLEGGGEIYGRSTLTQLVDREEKELKN